MDDIYIKIDEYPFLDHNDIKYIRTDLTKLYSDKIFKKWKGQVIENKRRMSENLPINPRHTV